MSTAPACRKRKSHVKPRVGTCNCSGRAHSLKPNRAFIMPGIDLYKMSNRVKRVAASVLRDMNPKLASPTGGVVWAPRSRAMLLTSSRTCLDAAASMSLTPRLRLLRLCLLRPDLFFFSFCRRKWWLSLLDMLCVIGKGDEVKFAASLLMRDIVALLNNEESSVNDAFTQYLSINMGDAKEVSQHYRLMSRQTRDCLGVSFRCYAYIPVSGQEIYSSLKLKPPSTHHYSAFQSHTPSMATLNFMFSDLEAGCCANTVEA
ncbi:hypothetical protein F2Q69_00021358 [Brassica cretica]|uniref:Uncharacterized protein n=1 Tax=Brassica cretica TaxID=69181 RepID=A0A8S9Q9L1_BRACR|nr:hypothetical protein F2Q69_00021358 [Brassica cretica]